MSILTDPTRKPTIPPRQIRVFIQRSGEVAVSTVCRVVGILTSCVVMGVAVSADAATMYTVTDLGSNYTLHADPTGPNSFTTGPYGSVNSVLNFGAIHSVTSGDGSQTYAFEKAPVSATTTYSLDHGAGYPIPISVFSSGQMIISSIGDPNESFGNLVPYTVTGPYSWGIGSFLSYSSPLSGLLGPVNDINPSGFVVEGLGGKNGAFISYPGQLGFQQNLNDVISDAPGVQLSSAVLVDNLGDIIAVGTLNGQFQDFLLTPNGAPTPAPEPSTLAVWGLIGLAGVGMTWKRRKRVG